MAEQQPLKKGGYLVGINVAVYKNRSVVAHFARDCVDALLHERPVVDRCTNVGQRHPDCVDQGRSFAIARSPIQLDLNPRFE